MQAKGRIMGEDKDLGNRDKISSRWAMALVLGEGPAAAEVEIKVGVVGVVGIGRSFYLNLN